MSCVSLTSCARTSVTSRRRASSRPSLTRVSAEYGSLRKHRPLADIQNPASRLLRGWLTLQRTILLRAGSTDQPCHGGGSLNHLKERRGRDARKCREGGDGSVCLKFWRSQARRCRRPG